MRRSRSMLNMSRRGSLTRSFSRILIGWSFSVKTFRWVRCFLIKGLYDLLYRVRYFIEVVMSKRSLCHKGRYVTVVVMS